MYDSRGHGSHRGQARAKKSIQQCCRYGPNVFARHLRSTVAEQFRQTTKVVDVAKIREQNSHSNKNSVVSLMSNVIAECRVFE